MIKLEPRISSTRREEKCSTIIEAIDRMLTTRPGHRDFTGAQSKNASKQPLRGVAETHQGYMLNELYIHIHIYIDTYTYIFRSIYLHASRNLVFSSDTLSKTKIEAFHSTYIPSHRMHCRSFFRFDEFKAEIIV